MPRGVAARPTQEQKAGCVDAAAGTVENMESVDPREDPHRARSRALTGIVIGGAAVLSIVVSLLFALASRRAPEPLPILGQVPPFSLVASDRAAVSQSDLHGRIWVADFIFTRCSGVCPILTDRMARLQGKLERIEGRSEDTVRLVSFTVDPLHDDPETLQEYAQRFGADARRWVFLTGERHDLYTLIRDGFRLAVVDDAEEAGELITHSDRFVLVDRDLRIRAYYRGTEADAVDQVLRGLQALRAEDRG
jgi:protein SCO1/2